MEVQGKVVQICEPQKFNGRNGEFTKYGFVVETAGQYPKKIHFQVFGDERWNDMAIKDNEEIVVSFDVASREWQGKWFTSCDAWRILRDGQTTNNQAPQVTSNPQTQQSNANASDGEDQLPF